MTDISEFNIVFDDAFFSCFVFFFNSSSILLYSNLDGICGGFL